MTISSPKSAEGLGFCSLLDFNVALLAKQLFRVLTHPTTLWACILRGHYFADGDAHNASKGSRASWAWNSLLHRRDLIVHGARWQVGNGKEVNIWQDKWLTSFGDRVINHIILFPLRVRLINHTILTLIFGRPFSASMSYQRSSFFYGELQTIAFQQCRGFFNAELKIFQCLIFAWISLKLWSIVSSSALGLQPFGLCHLSAIKLMFKLSPLSTVGSWPCLLALIVLLLLGCFHMLGWKTRCHASFYSSLPSPIFIVHKALSTMDDF